VEPAFNRFDLGLAQAMAVDPHTNKQLCSKSARLCESAEPVLWKGHARERQLLGAFLLVSFQKERELAPEYTTHIVDTHPVDWMHVNAQPNFTASNSITWHSFYLSKSRSAIRFFSRRARSLVRKKVMFANSGSTGICKRLTFTR